MKFPLPLGLVFAISLSALQALPPSRPSSLRSVPPPAPPVGGGISVQREPTINPGPPFPIPRPNPAPPLSPPSLAPAVAFRSSASSAAEVRQVTPKLEVWRTGERVKSPQKPKVRWQKVRGLARAYLAGNDPVHVRLLFDPGANGKAVALRAAQGIALKPNEVLHVQPTGECIVSVTLDPGMPESHVSFYCAGLTTTLVLMRATAEMVAAAEEEASNVELVPVVP